MVEGIAYQPEALAAAQELARGMLDARLAETEQRIATSKMALDSVLWVLGDELFSGLGICTYLVEVLVGVALDALELGRQEMLRRMEEGIMLGGIGSGDTGESLVEMIEEGRVGRRDTVKQLLNLGRGEADGVDDRAVAVEGAGNTVVGDVGHTRRMGLHAVEQGLNVEVLRYISIPSQLMGLGCRTFATFAPAIGQMTGDSPSRSQCCRMLAAYCDMGKFWDVP